MHTQLAGGRNDTWISDSKLLLFFLLNLIISGTPVEKRLSCVSTLNYYVPTLLFAHIHIPQDNQ